MKQLKLLLACAAFLALLAPCAAAEEGSDGSALTAYLKGVYLEAEGDFYNAYQYYLYASARDPGNGRILLRLAKVATEVGDYEDAKKYCEELVRSGAPGPEARMILAEVEYRLGNREAALAALVELRDRSDVPRFSILKFLAKVYRDLGRTDDACRTLEEASRLPETDPYVFYELGVIYAEEGKLDEARETLERAVVVDPDFAPARLVLAKLYMHLGRREEGKASFREALRLEPLNRDALTGLTDALYEDGEYAEGAALLDPIHRDGDLDEGGLIVYGRFLYKAGRAAEAIAIFSDLIAKTGDKPALLRVIAEMEIERGNFSTAYGYLRRLAAAEPGRFENHVGALLLLYGAPSAPSSPREALTLTEEEKKALLDEAITAVDSDSDGDNFVMGSILRKAGETERAERFLLRAEKINGENGDVRLELATLYGRAGRYDDALTRVVSLYEKNPEDATLANFYGYLLAEKGENLDLAEELLGKALAKEPDNGYFLDSLGWIRFKKGLFREALEILLGAAEKAGDDAVIWEHIGDAYARLNESEKAREAYRKSLSIDPKAEGIGEKMRSIEIRGKDGE